MKKFKFNTGVVDDKRSTKEKSKDWKYSEIASGEDVVLQPITSWDEYSIQNQVQSSSCVWQAIAKAHEVIRFRNRNEKINHSAGGYAQRINKPGLGTSVYEGLDQAVKQGIPFEEDIPSEGMDESHMNDIKYADKLKNIPDNRKTFTNSYIPYMPKDFMTVAKEVAKGNPVPLLVRCAILEWSQSCPQIYGGVKEVSHEVCAVQSGLFSGQLRGNIGEEINLVNEPVIRIDDSWGNLGYENKGFRLITKKFFDKYIDMASLFVGFTYKEGGVRPELPTKSISFGQTGVNVKRLQKCLCYLGYFPLEIDLDITSNNRYGNVTRSNVKELQLDNKEFFKDLGTSLADLKKLDGRYVRKQTLQLLESLIN